jgi:hypothetical protein
MSDKKRSPAETWMRVYAMATDDDYEDVFGMSENDLDREITEAGGDPKAIGERGAALAEKLLTRRTNAKK